MKFSGDTKKSHNADSMSNVFLSPIPASILQTPGYALLYIYAGNGYSDSFTDVLKSSSQILIVVVM